MPSDLPLRLCRLFYGVIEDFGTSAISKPTGVNVAYAPATKKLTITVTTSVAAGGVVTIPVVLDGEVTVNKTFSFAIAKTGATGATGAKDDKRRQGRDRRDRGNQNQGR